ncbi:Transketolase family protein [Perilla frutescens var. hirtella]|nr:Transketolase family protein [Perilla frutescens var. hirtella]
MAIGAAMTGLRPVIEGMNMGFLLLAFNQISDNCGMLHYTSGGQFKIPTVLSLEEAELVRPGEHVMQAAKTLVNKGYDPEVIDIRSLKPFDLYTIGNSVKKTHKVIIVEECMRTGGIGASLTAAINENFHDYIFGCTDCVPLIAGCTYSLCWDTGGIHHRPTSTDHSCC